MSRKRRFGNEETPEGSPSWLTTYSDLVTLLLTFFVMLYSMSVLDQEKFTEAARSMRSTFLNLGGSSIIGEGIDDSATSISELGEGQIGIEEFKREIKEEIERTGLDKHISVIDEGDTITLRFNSLVLFDSGSADIKETAIPILTKTGELLKNLDSEIEVQGHTDNLPINTLLFPSNWELSTKRATNIVQFFIRNCGVAPEKLTATGNAEFRPVAPNDTEENRQKNRRIDIVVMK